MRLQPLSTKIILRLLAANLSTTANQLSATSVLIQQNPWRLQTKWYGKLSRNVVQGADEVGTESFFGWDIVDFLIHSEQYANTGMAVLIRRVTCKSFFSFLGSKKSFNLRNLPSRTSTLFLSRRSACPFLNCDQVSNRFTEFSGKLTFYTLCSRKVRYWKEIYVFINVS